MGYIIAHWCGRHALHRSFWINFAVLRAVIYAALAGLALIEFIPLAVFVALIGADIALFAWQAVGVVRSGEAHIAAYGSMAPVWGSYLAMVWALFFFAIQWLGLYQHTVFHPPEEPFTTKMERQHASTYELTLSDDGATLTLTGDVAPGSTKILRRLLTEKEEVRALILDSPGGNIYEARGIARLVLEHGLTTHIDGECSSACTVIFVSGKARTMGETAKLGFHQYRLDTSGYEHGAFIPGVNVAAEQERDRSYFERQAITPEFLKQIFQTPHSGIWYPERDELRAAGVLTE